MDELGGTILGVWAHPDDEAYLSAGLMARAVRNGSRVVCVTATRGEGGSMDEEAWPPETMGEVRTRELERSLEILGVGEHHWLDLPDIDMDTGLPEEGYAKVRSLVAEVQPDAILTFGPDGMTDHAAHKDVSRWATTALRESGKSGSRVLYATVTPEWAEEFLPIWEPFNVFLPGTPHVVPREELVIHYELPPDILQTKVNAINAHVSQIEGTSLQGANPPSAREPTPMVALTIVLIPAANAAKAKMPGARSKAWVPPAYRVTRKAPRTASSVFPVAIPTELFTSFCRELVRSDCSKKFAPPLRSIRFEIRSNTSMHFNGNLPTVVSPLSMMASACS